MIYKLIGFSLIVAFVLTGCISGAMQDQLQWAGSMREVLREGKTQARASLDYIMKSGGTYAVGALEGLEGEILILDDKPWVSQTQPDGTQRTRLVAASEFSATLFVATHVATWNESSVEQDTSADGFEEMIIRAARRAGKDINNPLPFLLAGEFTDVDLHIVNKTCPMQARQTGAAMQPYRGSRTRTYGIVFGIFAADSAGILTHHGSRVHAHILILGDEPLMGHLDSIGVAAGAKIRFPREYRKLN
jgi:alpha-acetolactate decarboxylase